MDDINNNHLTGTDKTSPKWILTVKSTVRPFLTYIFSLLYVYTFIFDPSNKNFNSLSGITITIIAFWFADRILKNVGGDKILTLLLNNKGKTDEKSR